VIDLWHEGQPSEFWLTGNGILTFTLNDEEGVVCYVRLDDEAPFVRLHTQFLSEGKCSKRRLVIAMIDAFKVVIPHLVERGFKGIVAESISPTLIAWLQKQGFVAVDESDDYVLRFASVVECSAS